MFAPESTAFHCVLILKQFFKTEKKKKKKKKKPLQFNNASQFVFLPIIIAFIYQILENLPFSPLKCNFSDPKRWQRCALHSLKKKSTLSHPFLFLFFQASVPSWLASAPPPPPRGLPLYYVQRIWDLPSDLLFFEFNLYTYLNTCTCICAIICKKYNFTVYYFNKFYIFTTTSSHKQLTYIKMKFTRQWSS